MIYALVDNNKDQLGGFLSMFGLRIDEYVFGYRITDKLTKELSNTFEVFIGEVIHDNRITDDILRKFDANMGLKIHSYY